MSFYYFCNIEVLYKFSNSCTVYLNKTSECVRFLNWIAGYMLSGINAWHLSVIMLL